MIKKLFIVIFLLNINTAFAQSHKKSPIPQPKKEIDYKEIGAGLPDFKVTNFSGKNYTKADFKSDANLLVMIFNPLCGHCEDETDSIVKNIDLFKESKLLMLVHPNNGNMMSGFIKDHHLDKCPSIAIGIDSVLITDKLFLYKGLPQINVYDKRRKLIKTFTGDIPVDSMKPYIQ